MKMTEKERHILNTRIRVERGATAIMGATSTFLWVTFYNATNSHSSNLSLSLALLLTIMTVWVISVAHFDPNKRPEDVEYNYDV